MNPMTSTFRGGNLSETMYNYSNALMENKPSQTYPVTTLNSPFEVGWDESWVKYAPSWNVTNMNPVPLTYGEKPKLSQMPAFINQSRVSQFYQNNPYQTLLYANQFGLATMGGPVNPQSKPAAFPANTISVYKH